MRSILLVALLLYLPGTAFSQCSIYIQRGGFMYGSEVVPPVQSSLWGHVWVNGCQEYAEFTLEIHGPESITAVHLHGPTLEGGIAPVLRELPVPSEELLFTELGPWTDLEWDSISGIQAYVDVHTVEFPNGAIQGHLNPRIAVVDSPWTTIKQLYR